MTVAAVILAAHRGIALRDVEGVPNARRLADAAWAGGALPIVVVAFDPDGAVANALAGSVAVLAAPGPQAAGPVGLVCRGIDVARAQIEGTAAALIWPARMGWVDAETVTSLIEAHGAARGTVFRPAFRGEAGWPALVPTAHLEALRALDPKLMPGPLLDALANAVGGRLVELGDPGTVHDLDTPRAELPAFEGPAEPMSAHHHEWGSPAAAGPDEPPAPPRTVP
ncbi:MAG TPA: NTP transferase domain-containing protein [Patescibacteria group bacterium]|nr:NTP transferase domain-containing protein [Patescibacteria group bacterium]